MTGWIALSDSSDPGPAPRDGPHLLSGTLVVELSLPLPEGVLLDHRSPEGGPMATALSLFHDRARGLVLLHRHGGRSTRHHLPGPILTETQVARMTYAWDVARQTWALRIAGRGDRTLAESIGVAPLPMDLAQIAHLCAGRGLMLRDPTVLWFGITDGEAPPPRAPWFGLSTPVPTPSGPVPAGLLRPGHRVIDRDGHARPIRAVRRLDLPARGAFAPVVLRAPFFTRATNLLVSAEQPIAIGGLEVEYLFGEEEVLVEAGHLVDGRAALADNRRATLTAVTIDTGTPCLLDIDGCTLSTTWTGPADYEPQGPLRLLKGYEALPLMALLHRLRPADAA